MDLSCQLCRRLRLGKGFRPAPAQKNKGMVQAGLAKKQEPVSKIPRARRARDMAQEDSNLSSKYEA
jgi:hypothetical protein